MGKHRTRTATYLIIWSRDKRLSPGMIVKSFDTGEVLFVKRFIVDGDRREVEVVAKGVRLGATSVSTAVRRLLKILDRIEEVEGLTGVPREEIRNAVAEAFRKIAASVYENGSSVSEESYD